MTDLTDLTLEEKASLLSGRDFWSTKALPGKGIRSIVMTDGPHGVRLQSGQADHLGINGSIPSTCFPPAVAIGSSWDPHAAALMGTQLGREARALGVHVLLGPGINIKRSPLCGRNFEYYSEDPYLSGVLGSAFVTALQEEGPGASVKHFAANNQEHERMRISSDVDERTLREIYLPAFERVVREAKPATVMCSYNKVNGTYASENAWLLTDVLRHEWGFEGAVVSDWGAVSNRVAGVRAGMDLEMPGSGGTTDAEIVKAVHDGSLPEALVDASAGRVVALTQRWRPAGDDLDPAAGHAVARKLAAGSAVLLRNENTTLPLDTHQKIAVIGAFAETPRYQGGGSSHINPTRVETPLQALRSLSADAETLIAYAPGFALADAADEPSLDADAISIAREAEVAVVFAGLEEPDESEGFDRTTLDLPSRQVDLIRAVAAVAHRTVVVLSHGGILSLEEWHDDVDAILDGFLLGQAGGGALADLLFGLENPSGHLAETIPLRLEDTPSYLTFPGEQGHSRYGEGVMVGYRHHTSLGQPVRYPFGHGLSYSNFVTNELKTSIVGDSEVDVEVTVTNTGDRAGMHVVQVYVGTNAGPIRRPIRELRAFDKILLQSGEEKTISLRLDRRSFAYWDVNEHDWVVAPGSYRISVGSSVDEILLSEDIHLAGEMLQSPLTLDSTVGEWFGHPAVGPVLTAGMTAGMTPEQAEAAQNPNQLKMVESMPMKQFLAFTGDAFPPEALEQLMALSRSEQPVNA